MHDGLMYRIVAPTLRVEQQVKVFATIAPPNYALPWQNHPLKNVTGSGFIISGNRILTNAHVVADQAFVMVRKHGSPERFAARVLAAGHDCDLALLAVEDPSFFDSTLPVQFGGLPRLEVKNRFDCSVYTFSGNPQWKNIH
jgi:S1-C subfamily serine protease